MSAPERIIYQAWEQGEEVFRITDDGTHLTFTTYGPTLTECRDITYRIMYSHADDIAAAIQAVTGP